MKICVIAAMSSEINALEKSFSGLEKTGPLCYKSGDNEIHLLKCGVLFRTPKRLQRKLDILRNSDLVILCGICGAVNKDLKVGNIVIPDKIVALDNTADYIQNEKNNSLLNFLKECKLKVINDGVLATSDHFVSTSEKNRLSSVDIVDMESYNVLNWLCGLNIKVMCIRCVSDSKSQTLPDEKCIVEYMADPRKFLVRNLFKSPIICYRLLKLFFLSDIALNSLGKFITGFILFLN